MKKIVILLVLLSLCCATSVAQQPVPVSDVDIRNTESDEILILRDMVVRLQEQNRHLEAQLAESEKKMVQIEEKIGDNPVFFLFMMDIELKNMREDGRTADSLDDGFYAYGNAALRAGADEKEIEDKLKEMVRLKTKAAKAKR